MMRRTALYDEHVRAGARMVPFADFEMPVQYASILKEHDAVRHRAGLFDLSHMGQFWLTGDMVAQWADTLTINAVGTMKPLQARYNIFCNEARRRARRYDFLSSREGLAARRQRRERRENVEASQRPAARAASRWKTGTGARAHCDPRTALGRDACSRMSTSISPRCATTSARKAA